MAVAFKVAGNSSGRTYHASYTHISEPLEKRYFIHGFWPRYEVGIVGEPEAKVVWGTEALKVWEVSRRLEGYKRYKPKIWKK